MAHNTHQDVARRWANRILNPGRGPLSSNNLHDEGDRIFSYGHHFEVGRVLRDRTGEPTAWLLNGDRYRGVVTPRHQREVRDAVTGYGLPVLTIPHEALSAAGLILDSIQPVDIQRDWWTSKIVTKQELGVVHWEYDYREEVDKGGWRNTKTGEFVPREGWYSQPPAVECNCEIEYSAPGPWSNDWRGSYYRDQAIERQRETHVRARHGVWEELKGHSRQTGRKRAMSSRHVEWDVVDDPTAPLGYVFQREVRRHWLGGSLIRAQVPYQARTKHAECGGTGVAAEPWFIRAWTGHKPVLGPLNHDQMLNAELVADLAMERNGGIRHPFGWPTVLDAYDKHTGCRGCNGTGRVSITKRRWAYFLSAFDEGETRPSYFFCELPPKVHPTTVEEALECLKPEAVKLAEQAGREVKRQGDIFAIPMPGVTLRELKAQGGVHIRKPRFIVPSTGELWADAEDKSVGVWSGPRPQLLGTNHEATEIVLVGKQTYARGTLRHVPEGRNPDHRPVNIGREWHLIQKNTVPVSA